MKHKKHINVKKSKDNDNGLYLNYIKFYKKNKPKYLRNICCFNNLKTKAERLLFISGLKYKRYKLYGGCYATFMYTYKEFLTYIKILKSVYPDYSFTYDDYKINQFFTH